MKSKPAKKEPKVDPKQPVKPTIHTVDDICCKCAEANGGKMPPGSCNTMHEGKCELCGETATLTTKHDYVWPKKLKIGYVWD